MRLNTFIALVISTGAAAVSRAEVLDLQPNLFVIESRADAQAGPAAVYAAITRQVSKWWDPEHTWSGSSANMSIEPRAGGCFCEKLSGGGSVQHGRVINAQPGKVLRLEAALGPLQDMAVTGILTFKFESAGSGTRILMSYRVAGPFTMDASKLAPAVDKVLGAQLSRLQRFVDTGMPAGDPPK